MKQESPIALDVGIQQQNPNGKRTKSFVCFIVLLKIPTNIEKFVYKQTAMTKITGQRMVLKKL